MKWFLMATTIGIAGILVAGVRRAAAPGAPAARIVAASAGILGLWVALAFVLGGLGVFATAPDRSLPVIAFGISVPIVAGWVVLATSQSFRTLVRNTPLPWLVGVQAYRVVGVVFLVAFLGNDMPALFAMPAAIGDVLVGVTAPLVALSLARQERASHALAVGWCVAGIADLAIAVTLGFLTSPSPFQQLALETPNLAITRFPFVLVPIFAVPVSILLHVLVLWRLAGGGQGSPLGAPARPAQPVAPVGGQGPTTTSV